MSAAERANRAFADLDWEIRGRLRELKAALQREDAAHG
jgi:hypothetical protein